MRMHEDLSPEVSRENALYELAAVGAIPPEGYASLTESFASLKNSGDVLHGKLKDGVGAWEVQRGPTERDYQITIGGSYDQRKEALNIDDEVRYLDSGGEHVVYEMTSPEWAQQVVKINHVSLRELLDQNARAGRALDTIPSEWRDHLEQEVKRREQEYQDLKKYFGTHVPRQHTEIAMVPISHEQIRLLYGPNQEPPAGYATIEQLPAVVTFQEKLPLKELSDLLSLHFGSIDLDHLTEEQLRVMRDNFSFENTENVDYVGEIERLYPPLRSFIAMAKKDPAAKRAMRDFTESLMAYTGETARGLDLVGRDNAVFYSEKGMPDYKLLDVIQLEPKNLLSEAKIFEQWLQERSVSDNIGDVAPDNIHYLRAINALAWISGSDKRLSSLKGQDIAPHVARVVDFLRQQTSEDTPLSKKKS